MGNLNYAIKSVGEEAVHCSRPESIAQRYKLMRDEIIMEEAGKIGRNTREMMSLFANYELLIEGNILS